MKNYIASISATRVLYKGLAATVETGVRPASILAESLDGAEEEALLLCTKVFPAEAGYVGHAVSVMELP